MSRSRSKGPYIDAKLLKKVDTMTASGQRKVIKTWSRDCTIIPQFVGHTLAVHNGCKFVPVLISEPMIGHKLGEFSFTRTFRGHAGNKKK